MIDSEERDTGSLPPGVADVKSAAPYGNLTVEVDLILAHPKRTDNGSRCTGGRTRAIMATAQTAQTAGANRQTDGLSGNGTHRVPDQHQR